ncbi:MAG: NnrU family protein [Pseudomonadota bacterium]
MSGFADLAAAALAFVGSHFALSAPLPRTWLAGRLGERAFVGLYSAVALAAFAWLGIAYGRAPTVELWAPPAWIRGLPVIVMPLAALLLVCGTTQYNPTAVVRGFDPRAADPAPGILKVTRHPIMWAIGLWGLAHLPANGDIASVILFGSLAVLALLGTLAIDAKRRVRDPQGFARLAAATSNLPFVALATGRAGLRPVDIGWWRVGLTALVYVGLWAAHPWIAGVPVR